MENNYTSSKIVSSLLWKFLERVGTQGITFVVQIILARLLLPEEYGIVAIINVFIILANILVQSGLNSALVQKKDADETDFSTVFFLSIFISILLYLILFLFSINIADFYNNSKLVLIIRVLSLVLIAGAVNSVQIAYISKNLLFKKLLTSSITASSISGIIGIIMALYGWGVWALVLQQLLNQFLITLILWYKVRWRPHFRFSIDRLKLMFSFGWKLLVSSLLNTLYNDMRTLVIGKVFSASTLGYYNRGKQFPGLIIDNINGSIQAVLLPALSSRQDNLDRVKNLTRKSISISTFIVLPIIIGLAVVAEPMVHIILTDKWLPAVPFIQIYCIIFALRPIQSAHVQAINSLGRSDIFLKIEITRTIFGLIILFISIPFGVFAIAFGELLGIIYSSFFYSYPNVKLIGYSYIEQLNDIFPAFIITVIMSICVYAIQYISMSAGILLILQITFGIIFYIALAFLFRLSALNEFLSVIIPLMKSAKFIK
ncbi:MAG: flippase [Firmicutes bacterium HGW-Firmicutes-10]|nr:MAG: flippase [Firmicutes bacterium HGW-Firmicutes-10]